jgi:phosphatidylglycerol lysyltransferase
MADVTRRLPDAPQGVLEILIYEAFMIMRDEGVEWGSMGLSPLANVRDEDHKMIISRLFEFVYENLNRMYGFKALHHSKEKYAPTEWQNKYIAYHPTLFSPKMAYAIVKSQNPKGIPELLQAQLKKQLDKNNDG